jgi:hypothetical protein
MQAHVHRTNVMFMSVCSLLFVTLSLWIFYNVPSVNSCIEIDSVGYDRLAHNFQEHTSLLDPLHPHKAPVQTVGYPLCVGLIYKICGHVYWPVIALQVLLCLLALLLTYSIAAQLFGSYVSMITALFFSFNLGFLVYAQFLLTEVVLVVCILAFIERLAVFYTTRTDYALAAAGCAMGVSIIIKPVLLFFFFVMIVMLLALLGVCVRAGRALLIFSLCFWLPVGGYMVRNKMIYGCFNLAPMMSLNMYHCFLAKVVQRVEGGTLEQAWHKLPPFQAENSLDEQGWNEARVFFIHYIKEHLLVAVHVWCENVAKTFFGLYSTQLKVLLEPQVKGGDISFFKGSGNFGERLYTYINAGTQSTGLRLVGLFEAIYLLLRYVLILIAGIAMVRRKEFFWMIFFCSFIAYAALVTGFDGCGRYRMVFEPLLLILCASGITQLFNIQD